MKFTPINMFSISRNRLAHAAIVLLLMVAAIRIQGYSQTQARQMLDRIMSTPVGTRPAVADSCAAILRAAGIPFVEGDTASFIYKGNYSTVNLSGDMNGWATNDAMWKIPGTSYFYYARFFERNARLDYKFILNGSTWILDPWNPRTCSGGFGPNSEFAMPGYVQPWEITARPGKPQGVLISKTIHSNIVGANYALQIYLPPGYDTSKRYPSVWFQDGGEYVTLGSAKIVLDNLIDSGRIVPVIGVFVTPNNRNEEYAGGIRNNYHNFFAQELVPFVDSLFKTRRHAGDRLVMGDSYGGNISALISYYHPDVFGNCGLHSGAFQNYNYEPDSLWYHAPAGPTRFVSVWGTYEGLWRDMRAFRDTMRVRGHYVHDLELPEGHSWGQWRATIDFILENVFPADEPDGVAVPIRQQPSAIALLGSFPNPFNPVTTISFSVLERQRAVLKIYTVLGQEIATLFDEIAVPGREYRIPFEGSGLSSGLYFSVLTTNGRTLTGKLVLAR